MVGPNDDKSGVVICLRLGAFDHGGRLNGCRNVPRCFRDAALNKTMNGIRA